MRVGGSARRLGNATSQQLLARALRCAPGEPVDLEGLGDLLPIVITGFNDAIGS